MTAAYPTALPRPFFSYYGGKWRAAMKYPAPRHDVVVEPFAGSAGYSLRHQVRRAVLCDVDEQIVGVWRYLLRVTPLEVLSLPDLEVGQSTNDLRVHQEARWLIGFWLQQASTHPGTVPSKWHRDEWRPRSGWCEAARRRIAAQLEVIRRWEIHHCSYTECPVSGPATWFVDPPYVEMGVRYRFGSDRIDFEHLGTWCESRPGQTIVCEQLGADWLPFELLHTQKTARKGRPSKEAVWTNAETAPRAVHSARMGEERG